MGRLRDLLNGGAAPAPVVETSPEPAPVAEPEATVEEAPAEEASEPTE